MPALPSLSSPPSLLSIYSPIATLSRVSSFPCSPSWVGRDSDCHWSIIFLSLRRSIRSPLPFCSLRQFSRPADLVFFNRCPASFCRGFLLSFLSSHPISLSLSPVSLVPLYFTFYFSVRYATHVSLPVACRGRLGSALFSPCSLILLFACLYIAMSSSSPGTF